MDNPKLVQLEAFFAGKTLPQTIALGPGETITDLPKFLHKPFHGFTGGWCGEPERALYD